MVTQYSLGQVESFPKESPRLVSKPEIVIPDSLLPLQKDVKVLVTVTVDTSGIPSSPEIVHSSDNRFDRFAIQTALRYRFDARSELTFYKTNRLYISIPIVLKK